VPFCLANEDFLPGTSPFFAFAFCCAEPPFLSDDAMPVPFPDFTAAATAAFGVFFAAAFGVFFAAAFAVFFAAM
jgi:hypothetical protein